MSEALAIERVTKRYGQFVAVDEFSLRVPRGQVLGFLGPNGAGKTTTIRMVMSIIHPDSGSISVLGHPRASEVKDRIGYLPEERGLYRKMTVREILEYIGQLKGLHGAALRQRIDEGLERVGLGDWKRKKVEALSKGMQQKLQFVATILHQPELLILDEPFSGLDPLNTHLLEQLVEELRAAGTTVLFSTHQMNQAERLCDRIALINKGRLVIEGTVPEVRSRFAGRVLVIDAEGDLGHLRVLPGVVSAQVTAGHARLELDEGVEPNSILQSALARASILRFEVQSPSLQEIFVKLVGGVPVNRSLSERPAAEVARG
ncbi:MAG: ATP-binding cassette domain-containing protein [Phycisphaerales bacterium]|nr:ATP-binding cassette domain-containing protein [Phycisphaerales bacterium]